MFTKDEVKLFNRIDAHKAPYHLPTYWTKAIQGLVDKGAILVHNNCARITPEGYEMRETFK